MIGIVGGGVAGLVAAHQLIQAGVAVTVIERANRLGGQIWTEPVDGFLIEHGAEGYAAGRRSVADVVADLQLTDRLVSQNTSHSMVLRCGRLEPLPVSDAARLAGIQADRTDFGRGIASFQGGTGELTTVLTTALARRATIRVGTEALRLTPRPRGWQITTSQGNALEADAVILAIPAAAAARLVAPISVDAADRLESLQTVSSVSVSLSCPARAVALPPGAGGFVSPTGAEESGFRACDFCSAKFPGRAAEGFVLLRAFFRPGGEWALDASDRRWADWAVDAVWPALGIRGRPARSWVARWPGALPRYAADHEESLRVVEHLLSGAPPLAFAGAAYRPSGIAGAIESARVAARGLVTEIT